MSDQSHTTSAKKAKPDNEPEQRQTPRRSSPTAIPVGVFSRITDTIKTMARYIPPALLRGAVALGLTISVVLGSMELSKTWFPHNTTIAGEYSACGYQSGYGPQMIDVPGGSFLMGASDGNSDEKPQHEVTVASFAMGVCEVTMAEYDAFAGDTGRELPDDRGWGRENKPVMNVSWEDATAYANWLSSKTAQNCRLPSEAEWEYAARAGTTTAYWWGDEIGNDNANCDGCGSLWNNKQTAPVGSFAANPFGLYDTSGNVFEWTEDNWHDNYQGAPADGSAWLEENDGDVATRVVRGGSWFDLPGFARSAYRGWSYPDFRAYFLGFRVLCVPHS